MYLQETKEEADHTILTFDSYTVNIRNILGQGAYGIVYKATDNAGKKIAAKRIDGKKHPGVLNQDLNMNKLRELKHKNVVNILHFYQQENETLWYFHGVL